VHWHVDEGPSGCVCVGQNARLATFQQGMSIDLRSGRSAAIDALAGAGENTDRNSFDDFFPVFPKVELSEIVRAHEPCKSRKREFVTQRAKGSRSVACIKLGLDA